MSEPPINKTFAIETTSYSDGEEKRIVPIEFTVCADDEGVRIYLNDVVKPVVDLFVNEDLRLCIDTTSDLALEKYATTKLDYDVREAT